MARLASLLAFALAALAAPVSAVGAEPQPPFCDRTIVAPGVPWFTAHEPKPDGRLGFGPPSIRLKTLPRLVTPGGKVGYELFLSPPAETARPRWEVETILSRVHWRQRLQVFVAKRERQIRTVKRGRRTTLHFEVPGGPALYAVTARFTSLAGRPRGYLRFHFRVMRPTSKARLGLEADSYRVGQTVFGRIENVGTAPVLHGDPYSIERFDGTSWSLAPESPDEFILPQYTVPPGESSARCSPFTIPPSMPPGRYRMVKEVSFAGPPDRDVRYLTAEFDIVP